MKTTQRKQKQQTTTDPVIAAVRDLRNALHESQQTFAFRMRTAIRSIARYETNRPPKGKMLAEFARVATETGHDKLAAVFTNALMTDLGPARELTALGALAHVMIPRIRADVSAMVDGLKDESTDPQARITEAITKLDALSNLIVRKFQPYFPRTDKAREAE